MAIIEAIETNLESDLVKGLQADRDQPTAVEAPPEPPIPAKFQGLPVTEVYRSYQELESRFGKQGAELGELRKLNDQLLKKQLEEKHSEQEEVLDYSQDAATKKLIAKELAPLQEVIAETKKLKLDAELRAVHSDYMAVAQSDNFQQWVTQSPIRIELFARGDRNYETAPIIELLNMYKAMHPAPPAPANNDDALRNVSLETGGVSESAPRRTYRSADIIALQRTDPRRYQALQPEIMKAYAEGRVIQ